MGQADGLFAGFVVASTGSMQLRTQNAVWLRFRAQGGGYYLMEANRDYEHIIQKKNMYSPVPSSLNQVQDRASLLQTLTERGFKVPLRQKPWGLSFGDGLGSRV